MKGFTIAHRPGRGYRVRSGATRFLRLLGDGDWYRFAEILERGESQGWRLRGKDANMCYARKWVERRSADRIPGRKGTAGKEYRITDLGLEALDAADEKLEQHYRALQELL